LVVSDISLARLRQLRWNYSTICRKLKMSD
jgi:hypothetical protein